MPEIKSPVVEGLEEEETIYRSEDPEVNDLPSLRDPAGTVTARWELTAEERELIANGADVYVQIMTFGKQLQPSRVLILRKDMDRVLAEAAFVKGDIEALFK